MPLPLFVAAAMVPATWVPCQDEFWSDGGDGLPDASVPQSPAFIQSPSSAGFASRPPPSRAREASETKSYPATTLPARSLCVTYPVSITATVTPAPVEPVHAPGTFMPAVASNRSHCREYSVSFGSANGCISRSGST